MSDLTQRNFGLLIAYVIPGFIGVSALHFVSPQIVDWLGTAHTAGSPTVAGFLYITLASVFVGLISSTLRWLLVDSLLHLTGVRRPNWNLRRLSHSLPAFTTLIDIHYRYYQFYGNSFVSIGFYLAMYGAIGEGTLEQFLIGTALMLLLLLGARDALSKYYRRVHECMAESTASDLSC